MTRRYDQFCPVARALDVVGERWTLLVVRDLLMGPKRYTDLREGLPGIATDVLTARLRTLEAAGLVERRTLPRPAPATVYELTDAGRGLGQAVRALGRVGLPMLDAPAPGDDVRGERLVLALHPSFRPDAVPDLTESYELVVDGEPYGVRVDRGELSIDRGAPEDAAVTLATDARTMAALLTGQTTPDDEGVRIDGDRAALDRFLEAFAYPVAAL